MKRLFYLFTGLIGTLLYACGGANPDPIPTDTRLGYDFFPLAIGQFAEYNVQALQYSLVGPTTTQTYQIREVVKDTFKTSTGQLAYYLERYRRDSDAQSWQLDSVWTARREMDRAVRIENNVAFVKLLFPVSPGQRWNGNALNGLGPDDYEAENLDDSLTVNGQKFARTLTVVQQNDSSLVSLDRRKEVYARQTGLIYKEITQWYYCSDPACLGQGKIDFGSQVIYRIRRYGNE